MKETLEELSDEELMNLIIKNNHTAFSLLVYRHTDKFYHFAYRILLNKNDAEDIVQEAFLKLWIKSTTWKPEMGNKFISWFYKIVTNLCFDFNKKKSPSLNEDIEKLTHSYNDKSNNIDIHKAFLKLSQTQRTALTLTYVEDFPNKESAKIMGLNIKAFESLLLRAKKTLKDQIG